MNWLSQNWMWIVVGIVIAWYFMSRGGRVHGGHMSGHSAGGILGGMGHGEHGSGAGEEPRPAPSGANAPEAAIDPVGGQAVRTSDALTSIYQGKIYYFASKENRERFEAAPQDYAHKAAGQPLQSPERTEYRPRRRGGC